MEYRQHGFSIGVSLLICILGSTLAANQVISWALPTVGLGLLAISLSSMRTAPIFNTVTEGE